VDSELEVIRDEMEQTRANLADKLGALENQVRETVSGATEAVSSTVEGVKEVVETVSDTVESVTETFNVSRQVEQHPWMAFGAAVAAGFVASQLFGHSSRPAPAPVPAPPPEPLTPSPAIQLQPVHHPQPAPAPVPEPPKHESHSVLGSLGHNALESLESVLPDMKEVMSTVVSGVSGLAVGSLMGVIRDLAANGLDGLPEEWKGEVTKLIDQVTTQLGGKVQPSRPRPAQPQASHQPEQGFTEQPRGEKRQEGVPYDTQQHAGLTGVTSGEPLGGTGSRASRGVRSQPATGKL